MIDGVETRSLELTGHLRGNTITLTPDFLQTKQSEIILEEIYTAGEPVWFASAEFTALAVLKGAVRIVLFDAREKSDTYGDIVEYYANHRQFQWLLVPPGVYFGWQVVSGQEGLLCRVSKQAPKPVPLSDVQIIPFQWT
jgi:dTDP-4-dehydrorhamnose 3,5-epimerase